MEVDWTEGNAELPVLFVSPQKGPTNETFSQKETDQSAADRDAESCCIYNA